MPSSVRIPAGQPSQAGSAGAIVSDFESFAESGDRERENTEKGVIFH